jgi:Hint domain
MQELEAHLAKARFARRHLSKMAGIGFAALVAAVAMPKPAQAWKWDDGDHDRDDRHDWGGHGHNGYDPNCFLKGTKIRTITGERAVEDLASGDLLPTHSNRIRPIQCIGHYRCIRRDASRPWVRDALPVRIARSAIGPNVPHADLYVSQAHGIYIDGVLVRAGSLVNGTTIALDDAGDVTELEYYHIKLQTHDVIYAEGAPCETFAETADHVAPVLSFTGSRSRMKSHLRSALSPLVDRREKIDIIRDRIEDRALTMV